jgi:hypothetical protein
MRILLSALFISSVALFSCQPSVEDIIVPEEANDSIYIRHVVEIDTLFPSGSDTSQSTTFFYDASKRLIRRTFGEYWIGAPDGPDEVENYEYAYNGADTLPYRIICAAGNDMVGIYRRDTTFLFYNTQGIVARDSVINSRGNGEIDEILVSNYIRIADGHYRIEKKLYKGNDITTGHMISRFTTVNGNQLSLRDTNRGPESWNHYVSVELATYDNHPNPIARTTIPYPMLSGHFSLHGEGSRNNMLTWKNTFEWEAGPGQNYDELFDYKYRADGYPVSMVDKLSPEPTIKRLYIYTKL